MLGDIEKSWEENGKQVFQIKKEGERDGGRKAVGRGKEGQRARGKEGKLMERVTEALGRNSGQRIRGVTDFWCPGSSSAELPLPVVK